MNGEPASPVCAYCGLPVSPGLFRRAVGSERVESASVSPQQADDAYCCFGCRFAAAVSAENGEEGRNRWTLTRLGIAIFFSMNVMVFTMSLWSRDVYADHPSVQSTSAQAMYELLRYGCLLFTCPVLLLLGQPILEQCGQSLRRGQVTMDWLLLAGVVASFVYSILALLTGQAHVYFEVACMVLVAVTLGRWIEATGKLRTTQAVRSLQRLLPAFARVRVNGHTTQFVDRPLSDVMVGEVIRVLPGERIPLDGIVEQSRAHVDQQLITGESQPVVCETGDRVFAGSLNLDGDLTVRVETPASEGTLQRLVDLVTNALATKGQEQRLADRITAWFVPAVAAIAIGALLIHGMQFGWHEGLMTSLAVVLIACPCALGIATPMAFWAGLGTACRQQVLFRHGDALTTLARVKAVCFDKTGTITSGDVSVDSLLVDAGTSKADVLPIARALAETSTHPLSKAIVTYACSHADADQGAESLPRCDYVETIAGRGIRGQLNGVESDAVYLGNRAYMDQMGMAMSGEMRSAADSEIQSVAYLGWQGRVHGVFRFRETIRQESQQALARLREMGIHVAILTGDHASRGQYLSEQLGVDVLTDLLPQGKLNELTKLKGKFGLVAMVGDGVNDAPALAASDVGIAMGCGADVSRDAADVCLLGDDLTRIPWAIELARMTQRTIRQNLFWAFGYNGVGVTMAIFGWLNPIVAAIAMVGSSLFVISNSLALSATSVPDPFMPSRETDQKSHGTRPTVSRISGTLKPNMKEDLVKVPS